MSKTSNLLVSLVAATTVLAPASTGLAQNGGDKPIRMSPRDRALYNVLKLDAAQEAAWITYQRAIAPAAGAATSPSGERQATRPGMQSAAGSTAAKKAEAAETFRATLDKTQLGLFDFMAELKNRNRR